MRFGGHSGFGFGEFDFGGFDFREFDFRDRGSCVSFGGTEVHEPLWSIVDVCYGGNYMSDTIPSRKIRETIYLPQQEQRVLLLRVLLIR